MPFYRGIVSVKTKCMGFASTRHVPFFVQKEKNVNFDLTITTLQI